MGAIQVRGRLVGGRIELAGPVDVPDGTEVEVVAVPIGSPPEVSIVNQSAIGMRADREDVADSAAWVENLRRSRRNRLPRPD